MPDPRIILPENHVVLAPHVVYWTYIPGSTGGPGANANGITATLVLVTTAGELRFFRENAAEAKKRLEAYFSGLSNE